MKKYNCLVPLIQIIILVNTSTGTAQKMMETETISKNYSLQNNYLRLEVASKGAEMTSLKSEKIEYLWQADPEFWPRHAPILFPIVGRLVDHEYIFQGETYRMKQHGFARDNEFRLIGQTPNSLTFEQKSTQASKKIYPFDFVLQVKYTLDGKKIIVSYTVKNPSEKERLYFSIGAHPAFNCPFIAEQQRNAYELVFDKKEAPESEAKINGMRINKTDKVFEEPGRFTISDNLFDDDALIFSPNPFSEVTFVYKPTQKKYLRVRFHNFPYLGIWSAKSESVTPFVCIEPWYGITDRADHNKQLLEKEGLIKLEPQQTFNCSFTIETY